MFNRIEYKYKAKKAMGGRILNYFILFFVISLVTMGINLADNLWIWTSTIASILILPVLSIGILRYCRNCYYNTELLSDLFFGFKNGRYAYTVKIMLLVALKIFAWSCLLFIPGIIKAYEYSMIPWILTDDEMYRTNEIFYKTREYTHGRKMDLFVLDLSFIGWGLLAFFTCGLLSFYVVFYQNLTFGAFYLDVSQNDNIDVEYTETKEG